MRIVWGITGAGDYLAESLSVFRKISRELDTEVTIAVSREGEIVLRWYKLWDELNSSFKRVMVEKGPNTPFLAGPLQIGYYSLLVISPATANTTAKIAHGIADSLLTNCVAQAMKGGDSSLHLPDRSETRYDRHDHSGRQTNMDNNPQIGC